MPGTISRPILEVAAAATTAAAAADADAAVSARADVYALATFVQAYSLGLVLNDVTEKPLSSQQWSTFVATVLGNSL
jgi:hypothetical protein